jgi:hypothetical protein
VSEPHPTIAGFDLEGELGRGAMGVVYRARQRSTGRAVALKVIGARLPSGGTHRERFRREGEVMASLRHPGILGVHAAGVDGDVAWLACELIEDARTLDEAARGASLRRKVELARDVARALGHAHAAGVIHRDVKPGNVLVDPAGQVHVADFGVARADVHERLTRTGQLVGTPAYMPPEQLFGRPGDVGPHGDVWGVGAVLYELVAGRLPYEATSLTDLASKVAAGQPAPPSAHAPVPAELDAVILAALALDPGERPRDGEALALELDAWLEGREPPAARGTRGRRRRRAVRGIAALLVLLLLAATTRWAVYSVREREAAALLGEALEWDGAACASGARACAGGPHVLTGWAYGAGAGPAPGAAELRARAARLGPLAAGPAREAHARLVAHERLVRRRRELARPAEAGAVEADRVVDALLALEDRTASLAAVEEALRSALTARGPGAPEAVAGAWRRALERDLRVSPEGVAAAVAAAPADASLRGVAGAWASQRASEALTALLATGSLEAATRLPALTDLAGTTGVGPTVAAEQAQLLQPWRRLLVTSLQGQVITPDDLPAAAHGLWREVARAPRGGVAAAAATLAAAFGPARASTDGRLLLRGVRLAALADLHAGLALDALGTSARPATRAVPPSTEALLDALTFEAVACRLDALGTLRVPYGGPQAIGALAPASGSPELLAETLVASLRLEDSSGSALQGTQADPWGLRIGARPPGERRTLVAALDAIVAARPWSSAARVARASLEPDSLALWPEWLRALQGEAMDLSRAAASHVVGDLARTALLLPEEQARPAIDLLWVEARRWKATAGLSALLEATAEVELRRRPGVAPIGELECRVARWIEAVQLGREKMGVVLWNLGRRRAEREPALAERLLVEAAARDEEVARSFWPPTPLSIAELRVRLNDPAGARAALAQADLDPRRDEPAFVGLAARVERDLDGVAAALARVDRAIAANPGARADLLALRAQVAGP